MSAPLVSTEVATVYRVGTRRYLTRAGAFQASARSLIAARCDCEPGDDTAPGVPCRYHRDVSHFEALVRRLARWIRRSARAATSPQRGAP